ncbi:hypothetical protein [Cupriavidus basilensis]|nr:hypothetical protein [Cupriavidus basilensis]
MATWVPDLYIDYVATATSAEWRQGMSRNAHSNSKRPSPNIRIEKRHSKESEVQEISQKDPKMAEPGAMRQRTHRK